MSSERKNAKALSLENARLRSELAEVTQALKSLQETLKVAPIRRTPLERAEDLLDYRNLVKDSEGEVTLTPNGVIRSATPQFAEMMKSSLPDMMGKSFFDFVRLGCNEQFFDFLHQSIEGMAVADISLVTKTGQEIPAALTGSPFFSIGGKKNISLTFRANAAHKKTEEALRRSEERLQSLAELTSDVVWEFNAATDEVWRSEGLAELLGYAPNAVRPTLTWWKQNIHPDDRSQVFLELDRILKSGQGRFRHTYRVRKVDGTYAEVSNRAVAIRDEQTRTVRLIGSIVDVTEENRAQAAKREISKKIVQAQEQERQRVARELHDGVNQLLSSSSFRLNYLQQQLSSRDALLAEKVVQAKDLIEKAMSEVRLISRNLRPSELDDLGLNSALRSLCGDFQERTGVKLKSVCEDFGRSLPPNVELTIYRIAQEALNNVEKHACAKTVHLSLKGGPDAFVTLKVRDNGCGFDPENVRKSSKSGWGLDNMRERASLFHGKISLVSAPKKGTEVLLTIPIHDITSI